MRKFFFRVINFFRPQPQYLKLPVDQILENSAAMGVVDRFNDFYFTSGNPGPLMWRGVEMLKNPCDIWTYVEIFQEVRPALIIETGTHHGASAMFYADICACLGIDCKVVTIDINPKWHIDPEEFNIVSLRGYSTDPKVLARVSAQVEALSECGNVIVLLDSDHSKENITRELEIYSSFVTPGSYLIVEDTNINGHPSSPDFGPGPWEAVDSFLDSGAFHEFVVDRSKERFFLTFNPRGFLKKRN